MALPKFEKDMRIVSVLSDRPNAASNEHLDGLQLKQKFDEGGEALKEYINETLIPFLAGSEAAASLGIRTISGISEATNIQQALEALKFAIDNTATGAIPDGSLSGAKLSANAITGRELSANSVTAEKIADNAVSGDKIADNAVSGDKIADDGISGEKIADGSIANRHLGALVVENGNIADGTIDASGKLKDGSVTAKLLAAGSVAEAAIAGGAISSAKIADGAVSRAKLAQDALYSTMKVCPASYTITADDLGRTLMNGSSAGSGDMEFILPDDVAKALPWGAEIAILYRRGSSVTITFGASTYSTAPSITSNFAYGRSYTISDLYGLIAIKKIDTSSSSSYWLVTGNVEVVA